MPMSKRVLVVDDDPDHRNICATILRHYRYDVLEATDGEQAIGVTQTHQPDLVLMDAVLPLLDGWEATERLKSDPQTATIPIVMVSAHALASDQQRSEMAGVDSYLAKPCEPARVVEEVERFIGPALESKAS
jgi:two-component system cell cycle response regulator DivK